MAIAFVWTIFFLALGVRFASHAWDVVSFAAISPIVVLLADMIADRGKAAKRPMVAFALIASWLTFDARGWWTDIGTAWDHRVHTAHGFVIWSGNWDHAAERQWNELLRSVGFSVVLGALSWLAWRLARKIDWHKHLSSLRVVSALAAVTTLALTALLAVHGRDLPALDQHQPRRFQAIATLFTFRSDEPPPPEMNDRRSILEIGEGVVAVRECHPGCRLSLVRPPHSSCTMEMPNLRTPVVLRRDAKHDLWFFDDGVDLLAYRGSDLRCIDLSLRDLLLDVKPPAAWLWGGGVGMSLALVAQIAARLVVARARRRGREGEDDIARSVVSLEAFTVAMLFATMPPVVSTLLGAFVW